MTRFDAILHFFPLELTALRPHAKFEVSSFNRSRDIRGGGRSQNSKSVSRGSIMTRFDPILHFFRGKSPTSVSVPHLKFLASTVPEILGGSRNSKSASDDPHMTPFDPLLHFFLLEVTDVRFCAKFEVFLAPTVSEILWGSQNSKIGSRDPHMAPFDPILHFFPLELTALRLHAKFEVSSFNLPGILGGSEIPKVGNVTPHDPFLTKFCNFLVRSHRRPSPCQI